MQFWFALRQFLKMGPESKNKMSNQTEKKFKLYFWVSTQTPEMQRVEKQVLALQFFWAEKATGCGLCWLFCKDKHKMSYFKGNGKQKVKHVSAADEINLFEGKDWMRNLKSGNNRNNVYSPSLFLLILFPSSSSITLRSHLRITFGNTTFQTDYTLILIIKMLIFRF